MSFCYLHIQKLSVNDPNRLAYQMDDNEPQTKSSKRRKIAVSRVKIVDVIRPKTRSWHIAYITHNCQRLLCSPSITYCAVSIFTRISERITPGQSEVYCLVCIWLASKRLSITVGDIINITCGKYAVEHILDIEWKIFQWCGGNLEYTNPTKYISADIPEVILSILHSLIELVYYDTAYDPDDHRQTYPLSTVVRTLEVFVTQVPLRPSNLELVVLTWLSNLLTEYKRYHRVPDIWSYRLRYAIRTDAAPEYNFQVCPENTTTPRKVLNDDPIIPNSIRQSDTNVFCCAQSHGSRPRVIRIAKGSMCNLDFIENTKLAIKTIRKCHTSIGLNEHLIREVSILSNSDHPNLPQICSYSELACIVEFCPFTLADYTKSNPGQVNSILLMCQHIASALTYLHSQDIFHGRISLEHILVNSTAEGCVFKLRGLGSCRCISVTIDPIDDAPDINLPGFERYYDERVDIYDLGRVCCQLLLKETSEATSDLMSRLRKYQPLDILVHMCLNKLTTPQKSNRERCSAADILYISQQLTRSLVRFDQRGRN